MKADNIKVGNIYFVDFEPTEKGEFNGKHLAVVMKKNNDKITFVVLPMTSKERGVGINKISLGKLKCLPSNLREDVSYAVLDQLRTVNAKRFSPLTEGGKLHEAIMPRGKMIKLYKAIIKDFLHDVPESEIPKIFLG